MGRLMALRAVLTVMFLGAAVAAHAQIGNGTVAGLPAASGYTNKVTILTDCQTAYDCSTGGGSAWASVRSTGSAWVLAFSPPTVSLTAGVSGILSAANGGTGSAAGLGYYNIKDYGAVCDGTTDDRVAIQAALTAGAGKAVFIPTGTCVISPIADDSLFLTVSAGTKLLGDGMGRSILKVADTSGVYDKILYGSGCSNCEFRDFTIDANIANNSVVDGAELSSHPRIDLYLTNSVGLIVDRVEFLGSTGINQLVATGTPTDVKIVNCQFRTIGDDPNHVAHDLSAIYTYGERVAIIGNQFIASSVDAPGAQTAIETHSKNTSIVGNNAYGFRQFANITGVDSVGDDESIVVTGNTGNALLNGIQLWSRTSGGHTTGYGMSGVTISGNAFRFNQLLFSTAATSGIFIDPSATLPIRNLVISNNTLTWDDETTSRTGSTTSTGIGWYSVSGTVLLENVVISGNVIEFAPVTGIRFSNPVKNAKVIGNLVRNAGQSLDAAIAAAYKVAFFMNLKPGTGVEISNNMISDDQTTANMTYGVEFFADATTSGVEVLDNTIRVTGSTTTAYLAPYLWATNLVPRLRAVIPGFTSPAATFAPGSYVFDSTSGYKWETRSTETFKRNASPVAWKYSVVKIANGVNGCATAKGCWQVNSGTPVAAATATTQTITWLAAAANAALIAPVRVKTSTACAGLTAITVNSLGTTASAAEFASAMAYDLKAAVANTNVQWKTPTTPGATAAATNWTVTIGAGAENVDDITNGCAFDLHATWVVLP